MTQSPSAERRSPQALAHDPPVDKLEFVMEQELGLDAFLAELRLRTGHDDVAFERLLRHAGVHLDRRRLELDAEAPTAGPPRSVPAGTRVVAYSFRAEPLPLVLPAGAVLLEQDGVVAVDKPPFFTVQGTRASRFCSLERAVRERTGCGTLVPAHRLDRETSGLVLFVSGREAGSRIGRQFLHRSVQKEYLAIVHPPPALPAFEVSGRLVRILHPSHSCFELRPEGAGSEGHASLSRFEIVDTQGARALVRALPVTGRTHQLRVHLASVGSPIAGDSLYGRGHVPGETSSAERLLLHARSLTLRLGAGPATTRLEAPLPPDLAL